VRTGIPGQVTPHILLHHRCTAVVPKTSEDR
jgi:hypothetical protein